MKECRIEPNTIAATPNTAHLDKKNEEKGIEEFIRIISLSIDRKSAVIIITMPSLEPSRLLYATPSRITCTFYLISFSVRDESVINK